jgi:hypothetical protein
MAHLREGGRLPKHEGDRREQTCSEHGFSSSAKSIDHRNATFTPATKARGDPA